MSSKCNLYVLYYSSGEWTVDLDFAQTCIPLETYHIGCTLEASTRKSMLVARVFWPKKSCSLALGVSAIFFLLTPIWFSAACRQSPLNQTQSHRLVLTTTRFLCFLSRYALDSLLRDSVFLLCLSISWSDAAASSGLTVSGIHRRRTDY